MPALRAWLIRAERRGWNGYCVIAIGDGLSVNDALSDASKAIGSNFRPKQSGAEGIQLRVTIRRPDGTQFSVHPHALKECETPADLEAQAGVIEKPPQAKSTPRADDVSIEEWLEKHKIAKVDLV